MALLSLSTPLKERVDNFLKMRPNAPYIPLQQEDYRVLLEEGNLGMFDRPVKLLGTIHKEPKHKPA